MVRLTNDILCNEVSEIKLFNEDWIKSEYRIKWERFIDVEKIKSLKNTISMHEIKYNEYMDI